MSQPIIILMGVSGSGKTTVGKLLAAQTGIPFFDGDDFHPAANVAKMASGQPLTDEDRAGWLADLARHIGQWEQDKGRPMTTEEVKAMGRGFLDSLSTRK